MKISFDKALADKYGSAEKAIIIGSIPDGEGMSVPEMARVITWVSPSSLRRMAIELEKDGVLTSVKRDGAVWFSRAAAAPSDAGLRLEQCKLHRDRFGMKIPPSQEERDAWATSPYSAALLGAASRMMRERSFWADKFPLYNNVVKFIQREKLEDKVIVAPLDDGLITHKGVKIPASYLPRWDSEDDAALAAGATFNLVTLRWEG